MYGEVQRMGKKLGNSEVKHHTRTSEIRPKRKRISTKCLAGAATAVRKSNRFFFFFYKTEQFYTCRVDMRPNQRVEGKAPRTVSEHQKEGWRQWGQKERNKT